MAFFKYKLAYKVTSQQEFDEVINHLEQLEYKPARGHVNDYNQYPYMITNLDFSGKYSSTLGMINSSFQTITNKELFLALAAMHNDEEFHVSEYIVAENSSWHNSNHKWFTRGNILKNSIYQIQDIDLGEGVVKIDNTAFRINHIRKATKEELEAHFNKSTDITIEIGDIITSKNGSKYSIHALSDYGVTFYSHNESRIMSTDLYTHEVVREYINKGTWKVTKKKMVNNKDFTVSGNKYIKQALANDLAEHGFTLYSNNTCSQEEYITYHEDTKDVIIATNKMGKINYNLFQEYMIAKQAFLDLLPKEVIYKLECSNGTFDIKIDKDYAYYDKYKWSISDLIDVTNNYFTKNIISKVEIKINTINIGCDNQLQGVTASQIEDIIKEIRKLQ